MMNKFQAAREKQARFRKVFVQTPQIEAIWADMEQHLHLGGLESGAEAFLLMGPSGSGKSRMLKQFIFRQAKELGEAKIERDGVQADRLNFLCIDAPTDARIKAMAERMLEKLGDPKPTHGTQEQQNRRIANLLQQRQVQAIFVDETQHFIDRSRSTPRFAYDVADWIKERLNEVLCPIFLVGLEAADATVRYNSQLQRRATGRRLLGGYGYDTVAERKVYQRVLAVYQKAADLPEDSELAEPDTAARIHYAAGSLMGNTFTLLDLGLRDTLLAGETKITMECLARVFDKWSLNISRQVNPFRTKEPPVFRQQSGNEAELDELKKSLKGSRKRGNLLAA